jgi:nucleotide-binding universal stress UspA family protein
MIPAVTDNAEMSGPADERLKYLLVAHDCPEARLAAYYMARRAKRAGAGAVLLHVMEPPELGHWATVAETMRAEARDQAEATLKEFGEIIRGELDGDPQNVVREGVLADELRKLIEEDGRISMLFLGASADPAGPGPLVAALAKKPDYLGARPIPVAVVPGTLTRDDLRKIS